MIMIQLEHPFKKRCHDIEELFKDVCKMSQFCSRLEKQSTLNPIAYDPKKYLGDGFEMFIEALIKLSLVDNRIGITDYKIVEGGEDRGVDGHGIDINGSPACVQIKYKSNKTQLLINTEDHLTNLLASAYREYNVDPKSNKSLFIFTTGKGLFYTTEEYALHNAVKCYGYNELREMVDNNYGFWSSLRKLIA